MLIQSSVSTSPFIADQTGTPIGFTLPAATFTAPTVTGGSGTIILTSAGAHGLTTAKVVTPGNVNLVITGGTNWTAGNYKIVGLDLNTTGTVITLQGTYVSGMGSPTIPALNTLFTVRDITIPTLLVNSLVEIDYSWSSPDSDSKRIPVVYGGVIISGEQFQTANRHGGRLLAFQNRGDTSSQITRFTRFNSNTSGVSSSELITTSVDTSASSTASIQTQLTVADSVIILERSYAEVRK